MKTTLTFFICNLFFGHFLLSQKPYEYIIYDAGRISGGLSSTVAPNGNVVIGTAGGSIAELGENNSIIWTNKYISNGYITDIKSTSDNGFLAIGRGMAGSGGTVAIKIDASGNVLWSKEMVGTRQFPNGLILDSDSTYVVTGTSTLANNSSIFAAKLRFNGDTIWTRTFTDSLFQEGSALVKTPDGGYAITGHTFHNTYDMHIFLIKLNTHGDTVWTKSYRGSDADMAHALTTTSDGGFVIVGGGSSDASAQFDVQVIRTDSFGNIIWAKAYGSEYVEEAYSVIEAPDKSLFIAGRMQTEQGGGGRCPYMPGPCYDALLLKLKQNGDTLWTQLYGEDEDDWFYSMELSDEGIPVLIGQAERHESTAYIVQTDTLGKTPCSYNIKNMDVNDVTYTSQSNFKTRPLWITVSYAYTLQRPPYDPLVVDQCRTISIDENELGKTTIYPIPADDYIMINPNSERLLLNYTIHDAQGKVEARGFTNGQDATKVDISRLSKGLHFINLNNVQYKFIKN
ncbi:T9SS type A sorting domain-containing protein [Owenweeksia hongkongensis]|uniref:T9SS type A sorting domain-containing protein n=1 Tax=Owenweeksia hongkongensis TaxID=253245 RepID=UPI003A9594B2